MAPGATIDGEASGHIGLSKVDTFNSYEEMGRELLHTMRTYSEQLQMDGIPIPSLVPSSLDNVQCRSEMAEVARARIAELAQRILATTMDPGLNLLISSLQFHFCSCLKVAVDLQIASKIPKHGQASVKELAYATGAQEDLLARIRNIFLDTGQITHSLSDPGFALSINELPSDLVAIFRLDEGFRSASRQSDALRANGYREPVMGDKLGFNLAFQSDSSFWEYVTRAEPDRLKNFNQAMMAVNLNSLNSIPELYPFSKLSASGGLIVDIGGGLGQAARQILKSYPDCGLRCIVQDQYASMGSNPVVEDGCDVVEHGRPREHHADTGITLQQHNFFDPQPVKGAAAYFLRHIFHDWPDTACVEILRQIVPAMDRQYSRILICDQVMDEQSPSIPSVLYDIDMMSMFGGQERKLSEWEALIAETDKRLRITDVRKSSTLHTAIIELRLQ